MGANKPISSTLSECSTEQFSVSHILQCVVWRQFGQKRHQQQQQHRSCVSSPYWMFTPKIVISKTTHLPTPSKPTSAHQEIQERQQRPRRRSNRRGSCTHGSRFHHASVRHVRCWVRGLSSRQAGGWSFGFWISRVTAGCMCGTRRLVFPIKHELETYRKCLTNCAGLACVFACLGKRVRLCARSLIHPLGTDQPLFMDHSRKRNPSATAEVLTP